MSLFEEIVNESILLNEIVNRDKDIINAINNVLKVRISYDDKKDKILSNAKGKKERFILPVAYGLTKNGKRAVRAYQTAGSTKRGVPKWKLFLVDNIYSWSNGKKSFKHYGDTLIHLGLNTSGDKHMTTLYAITPIGNENVPIANNSNPIDSTPVTKTDVTPKTNQVQNPKIVNKTKKFVPASVKNTPSIDNNNQKSYFKSKVEAPETEPITKTDVQPQANSNIDNNADDKQITTTKPITKGEVENGNINKDNKLSNSFNDMLNRINDLENNKEDI